MKPTELILENFRNFRDVIIPLGKKITIVSGVNGVGKSNILSLIASGSGINKKSSLGSNFRPEFLDFFNIDKTEKYHDYRIYLKYGQSSESIALTKRLSFKDDTGTNRGIRIIPRTTNKYLDDCTIKKAEEDAKSNFGVGGSGRVKIPTIYLSLSRLYPLGENKDLTHISKIRKNNPFAKEEMLNIYREWYNSVIPGSIKLSDEISIIDKKACPRSSLHMEIEGTPALSQSIGQDNIGNIISALIDIYLLSKESDYNGALLCIDEIDVSLHPDTQIRLFELLKKLCDEISLQVIVSTHSLTILKESLKQEQKDSEETKVVYLKNPSMPIVASIKSYELLKNDMFNKINFQKTLPKIYFEDYVGQKLFIQHINALRNIIKLIKESSDATYFRNSENVSNHDAIRERILEFEDISNIKDELKQVVTHCGCDELMNISEADEYFNRVIIFLDGDARLKEKSQHPMVKDYLEIDFNPKEKGLNDRKHKPNLVFAPGYFAPESYLYRIIYELINNQTKYIDFWRGVDQTEEITLYTSDKIKNMFENLKEDFTNDDLKNIFKEPSDSSELWNFIIKSSLIEYYYMDYSTINILLDFAKDIRTAYNMTFPLTMENKKV
ncbi:AAA family ATPase [Peptostreptococcus sp.]